MTHLRIGVDTGGTFTDVVAVDTRTGSVITTKTPSTPTDPADGFIAGVQRSCARSGAVSSDIESILHGTTVATNQLLQGRAGALGFITTIGYESMLEIARQSVPDGYGNSYFWVKPDRIVPADLVRTVGGRLDFRGRELRPFDPAAARDAVRLLPLPRHHHALAVCFLHSYANDDARAGDGRRHRAASTRRRSLSLSSEVLPEYREYERAMTTLIDAAVKPTVARMFRGSPGGWPRLDGGRPIPFSIMQSNGGVLSADAGRPAADQHRAVRSGGRCAGCGDHRRTTPAIPRC